MIPREEEEEDEDENEEREDAGFEISEDNKIHGDNDKEKSNKEVEQDELNSENDHDIKNHRLLLDGCIYRGEGNANLVLSIPSERKVVRFRKSSPSSNPLADDGWARTIREIEFFKYVISPFLGEFVQPPEPLRVTRENVIKVSEIIRPLRPEYRRGKEILEDYATIFTDYAFIPEKITAALFGGNSSRRANFCVEIKPKQGFRNEFDEQFTKCTYCLTQYYKMKTGAIKSRSEYCPHDLFSGVEDRMKKSLRGLLESPQNNFKIFKNGVVVYDSNNQRKTDVDDVLSEWFSTGEAYTKEENFEKFFELVSAALLREFPATDPNSKMEKKKILEISSQDFDPKPRVNRDIVSRAKKNLLSNSMECNFTANDLPQDSVLGRVLKMQKLPYHSADLVYNIYSKHLEALNDEAIYSQMIRNYKGEDKISDCNGKAQQNVRKNFGSSDAAIGRISDKNGNENKKTTEDLRNNNNPRAKKNGGKNNGSISDRELEILQNYLLVTTAKDCSILMAFQEIDFTDVGNIPSEFIIETTGGSNFIVNIGVLDLDPKNIHCIEKHRHRDINVLISLADIIEKELDFRNALPFDPA